MTAPAVRRRLALLAILPAILPAGLAGPSAHAVSSQLDPTFGTGGIVTLGLGADSLAETDLALQADGGVVVVGWGTRNGNTNGVVHRLDASGRPDAAFGTRFLDNGGVELAQAVAVQPDGKLVVAGRTSVNGDAAVWRLLPTGELDPTFSGDGLATIDSAGVEQATDVAIAPDGSVVVAGRTSVGPGGGTIAVYRLTSAGVMDTSFDGDGAYGFGGPGNDEAIAVAVQADGKVVVTGLDTQFAGMTVRRLTTAGAPDPAFDVDGAVTVPGAYQDARALAIEPDGSILVAGGRLNGVDTDGLIVRVSPSGTLDASFGGVTGVRVDLGGSEVMTSLAVLGNGEVAATGVTSAGTQPFVVILGQDGTPDTSFGPRGLTTFGSLVTPLRGLTAQPDGKLLAVSGDGATVAKTLVIRLMGIVTTGSTRPTCQGRAATIVGTEGKDRLTGTKKADVVVALGGNDVVKGLGGNDLVCAGAGNDKVSGGSGKDRLYGEKGKDRLVGGSGKDRLIGGPDRDITQQ